MSDGQNCFQFLHTSIPSWLSNLAEIAKKIDDRQDEIEKIPVIVSGSKKKTASTESIKPKNKFADDNNPAPDPTQRERQLLLAKRKRKTASVISRTSGPTKYRTKSMLVVYYDSEVQKNFETLVRNIGTGRNLLRKGKMAARMEALSKEGSDNDDDDGDILSKIEYRPRVPQFRTARGLARIGGLTGAGKDTESFDEADKALEKAQSLCERGAHQVLRDGDCRVEIDGCKERFAEVFEISKREVERLKEKDCAVKKRQPNSVSDVRNTGSPEPAQPVAHKKPCIMDIEVDDADDDDDFVLPPIRLTSRC